MKKEYDISPLLYMCSESHFVSTKIKKCLCSQNVVRKNENIDKHWNGRFSQTDF